MRRTHRCLALARLLPVVAAVLLPTCLHAAPAGFGPRQYVRVTDAPITVTESFEVCRPERPFQLRLENGVGGQSRASSASVVLNGTEVVRERDLNQQVGVVEVPVSLQPRNVLTVRVAGEPGAAVALGIASPAHCLEVTLTSPPPGVSVPAGQLVVRGTVRGAPEAGVTINGGLAFAEGEEFAGVIAVGPEDAELVAIATAPDGQTAEARQGLTVTPGTEWVIRLAAFPAGGVAPLSVGFDLSSLVGVTAVALDATGTGGADIQGTTLEGQSFEYTAPGIYLPRVSVTGTDGRTYTASTIVQVYDVAKLDARLQALWSGVKDSLRRVDLDAAASAMHTQVRARYLARFRQLAPASLAGIDKYMTAIQLVEVGFGGAQYEMLRDDDGRTLSFAVWFQLDLDGVWRLRRY